MKDLLLQKIQTLITYEYLMRFGEKNYKYFTGYFCDDYKMK